VASLLAIAVLGVVMVTAFSSEFNRRLANLAMPSDVRIELQVNETRLAALKPPPGLEPATASAIQFAVVASFVSSFRLMMWICAALALASAAVGWRLLPGELRQSRANASPALLSTTGQPVRR